MSILKPTSKSELRAVLWIQLEREGSWRRVANLAEYLGEESDKPVPAGTLCAIAKGYPIPRKWLTRLLCPAQNPPRIAIHKNDMPSAARTLIKNLDPERLGELTDLLFAHAVHEEQGWRAGIVSIWDEDNEEPVANFASEEYVDEEFDA